MEDFVAASARQESLNHWTNPASQIRNPKAQIGLPEPRAVFMEAANDPTNFLVFRNNRGHLIASNRPLATMCSSEDFA
jgi:hypothetical protein